MEYAGALSELLQHPLADDDPELNLRQHARVVLLEAADDLLRGVAGRRYTGFIAWLIWLAVHIFFLIGFRNRLGVLINWVWNYVFFERAVRLILPRSDRDP